MTNPDTLATHCSARAAAQARALPPGWQPLLDDAIERASALGERVRIEAITTEDGLRIHWNPNEHDQARSDSPEPHRVRKARIHAHLAAISDTIESTSLHTCQVCGQNGQARRLEHTRLIGCTTCLPSLNSQTRTVHDAAATEDGS